MLAKIHGFWDSGPNKDKTPTYQSPLRIKAAFNDVKREAESLGSVDLSDAHLPLDKLSDFSLVFDGSHLTADSDDPPGGLPLSHLEEQSFVAVRLLASSYQIGDNSGYKLAFKRIYTLGDRTMWEIEIEKKGCGPIAVANSHKRSKKFYSEDDDC